MPSFALSDDGNELERLNAQRKAIDAKIAAELVRRQMVNWGTELTPKAKDNLKHWETMEKIVHRRLACIMLKQKLMRRHIVTKKNCFFSLVPWSLKASCPFRFVSDVPDFCFLVAQFQQGIRSKLFREAYREVIVVDWFGDDYDGSN